MPSCGGSQAKSIAGLSCQGWAKSSYPLDWSFNRRGGEEEEGMDDWDQEKLEEVVKQKHGTERNRPTEIICKFFLDAVEKKMYGW